MMIVLLLFLQKQNLANAIYLFGLGTLLSGLGLKHMRIRSHHDLAGTLVTRATVRAVRAQLNTQADEA
jgi:hypothetical protein